MRSPLFRPSAISALATRLVLTLNSANVVCRPSNSKASALPRLLPWARTTSARLFAAISVVDIFLPVMNFCCLRHYHRHCEERSDEAIQLSCRQSEGKLDCFAWLAMTERELTPVPRGPFR